MSKIKCGIDANEYARIHAWLRYNFGTANKCEASNCKGISNIYHYALKKGCSYKKIRSNFMMLCLACHVKYDWDESKRKHLREFDDVKREKIAASRRGRSFHSQEWKEILSKKMSGSGNHMYGVSISGKDHNFYGKHHTETTRKKIFAHRAKASKEQVEEIRRRAANGEKQIVLVKEFGLSKASICRIVKHKRYKLYE